MERTEPALTPGHIHHAGREHGMQIAVIWPAPGADRWHVALSAGVRWALLASRGSQYHVAAVLPAPGSGAWLRAIAPAAKPTSPDGTGAQPKRHAEGFRPGGAVCEQFRVRRGRDPFGVPPEPRSGRDLAGAGTDGMPPDTLVGHRFVPAAECLGEELSAGTDSQDRYTALVCPRQEAHLVASPCRDRRPRPRSAEGEDEVPPSTSGA